MLSKLKNYTRIYVTAAAFILLILKIFIWNTAFENDCRKISALKPDEPRVITLKAASMPSYDSSSVSFDAEVVSGLDTSSMVHVRIESGERLGIRCSDTLTVTDTARLADGAQNHGGFDYKKYLKSRGVCAVIYTDIARVSDLKKGSLHSLYSARQRLTERIFVHLPYNEASLVNALVTGSRDEMPESIKEAFRRAGVYHVVAVSGLHLNILILLLSYMYSSARFKRRTKLKLMLIANLSGAALIFTFTGFGVSIARAAMMSLLLCLSAFAYREYSPFTALTAVLFTLIFSRPYIWADTSLQLSFLATAGILFGVHIIQKYNIRKMKYSVLCESCIITGMAWIFTLPVTVVTFHGVSLVTVISNLAILAIMPPLMCFSYIFAAVCAFLPEAACSAAAVAAVVPAKAVLVLSEFFSGLPFAYVPMSPRDMALFMTETAFASLAVLTLKSKRKKLSCAILSAIAVANFSMTAYNINNRKCTAAFLNVGQGECALIRTEKGKTVMIDCGSESEENPARFSIIPYLSERGIYKIDAAIITHFHTDHTSAVTELIEDGKIKKLLLADRLCAPDEEKISSEILNAALRHGVKAEYISSGDNLHIDEKSEINVLSPSKSVRTDANNGSLVLMFKRGNKKILFAGDIEENAQFMLLGGNIRADILKVPHHGAFSAVSDKLAAKVNPKYAVISCGKNNRYSHPDDKTLKSYKNSEIYRTDINATIEFTIDDKGIECRPMYKN